MGEGACDGCRASEGFTLLELLVVIAVLTLVSALAFPSVGSAFATTQFAMARSVLQGATRAARAEAIRSDQPVTISVSTDGRTLLGNGQIIADLPRSVRLQVNGPSPRFFGDGSAAGGKLDIISSSRSAELVIADGTGAIGWQS